jgi:hypothetical protein
MSSKFGKPLGPQTVSPLMTRAKRFPPRLLSSTRRKTPLLRTYKRPAGHPGTGARRGRCKGTQTILSVKQCQSYL